MKYDKVYIGSILEKFLEGKTSEAEEQSLTEYFYTADNIPTEWQAYKEIFQSFKTDAYDFSQAELDKMLQPEPTKKARVIRFLPWASVACVAAVVVLFVLQPTSVRHVKDTIDVKPQTITVKVSTCAVERKATEKEQPQVTRQDKIKPNEEETQEISADELLEIVEVLADITPEDVSITVSNSSNGYCVKTVSLDGQSNSFMLRRCSNGSTIELTNQ